MFWNRNLIIVFFLTFSLNPIFCEDKFVFVKGGFFRMGDTFGDGDSDAKPVHWVYVESFYISKYEVTVSEFKNFVEKSGYTINKGGEVFLNNVWQNKEDADFLNPYYEQGDNNPVTLVNYFDAISFCNWLSERDDLEVVYIIKDKKCFSDYNKNGYRLPTEAEWEYASRGGVFYKSNFRYSGDNDLNSVGWYRNNSSYKTHLGGGKKANQLGIYDMSGNVWEWIDDYMYKYNKFFVINPVNKKEEDFKILRGGSFYDDCKHALQVSSRLFQRTNARFNNIGFRIVKKIR